MLYSSFSPLVDPPPPSPENRYIHFPGRCRWQGRKALYNIGKINTVALLTLKQTVWMTKIFNRTKKNQSRSLSCFLSRLIGISFKIYFLIRGFFSENKTSNGYVFRQHFYTRTLKDILKDPMQLNIRIIFLRVNKKIGAYMTYNTIKPPFSVIM